MMLREKRSRVLKKKDIKDFGIASDMNLAVDGRLKVHNFYYKSLSLHS